MKSTPTIDFNLTLAITANSALWATYGLVIGSVAVCLPNAVSLCSGMAQLALFFIYRSPSNGAASAKKDAELRTGMQVGKNPRADVEAGV